VSPEIAKFPQKSLHFWARFISTANPQLGSKFYRPQQTVVLNDDFCLIGFMLTKTYI